MQFTKETRAKRGWIETKRLNKAGQVVNAKDHVVVSEGMFNTKEMETVMEGVANDTGASPEQIRIEYYDHNEAPISANPRHRGWVSQNQWGGFGQGIRRNANHPVGEETSG